MSNVPTLQKQRKNLIVKLSLIKKCQDVYICYSVLKTSFLSILRFQLIEIRLKRHSVNFQISLKDQRLQFLLTKEVRNSLKLRHKENYKGIVFTDFNLKCRKF